MSLTPRVDWLGSAMHARAEGARCAELTLKCPLGAALSVQRCRLGAGQQRQNKPRPKRKMISRLAPRDFRHGFHPSPWTAAPPPPAPGHQWPLPRRRRGRDGPPPPRPPQRPPPPPLLQASGMWSGCMAHALLKKRHTKKTYTIPEDHNCLHSAVMLAFPRHGRCRSNCRGLAEKQPVRERASPSALVAALRLAHSRWPAALWSPAEFTQTKRNGGRILF